MDFFDYWLRHETMRLLAKVLPLASEECSNAVVEQVVRGPAVVADYTNFVIYNYLAWIVKHAPELGSAREAWKSRQDAHPDWDPLEHPDFPNWVGPSPSHPVQTVTPAELHQLISESPERAVERSYGVPQCGIRARTPTCSCVQDPQRYRRGTHRRRIGPA